MYSLKDKFILCFIQNSINFSSFPITSSSITCSILQALFEAMFDSNPKISQKNEDRILCLLMIFFASSSPFWLF